MKLDSASESHRSAGATRESRSLGRLVFLDAFRGIAALAVAWTHFYLLTPLHEPLQRVFPAPLRWFCANGGFGVQIFFVLSGFVIAYSVRHSRITAGFFARFTLRRSIRLDPPYWFALAVAVGLMALSHRVLGQPSTVPSASVIAAHIIYLQNVLGYRNIVSQFWTLPYEVQFYLVFVLLYGVVERFRAKTLDRYRYGGVAIVIITPLMAASLCCAYTGVSSNGWFIDRWYEFFLGVLTFWTLDRRVPRIAWWITTSLVLFLAWYQKSAEPLAVAVMAATIYSVGRLGRLHIWLNWRWIQRLGRISYSLYLVHFIGSTVCKLGAHRTGQSEGFAIAWFCLATAISFAAAEAMYIFIEQPSIRLTRRFKKPAREDTDVPVSTAPDMWVGASR